MKKIILSTVTAASILSATAAPAFAATNLSIQNSGNALANTPQYRMMPHSPRMSVQPSSTPGKHEAGWYSSNWSGYALSGSSNSYNDITSSWRVPTVLNQGQGSAYSSTWVGIDGFNNQNLIQTGTEQDYVNGSPVYYAWWQVMPNSETEITTANNGSAATVKPGDQMSAHLHNNGNGTWTVTIQDQTAGWIYNTTQNYSGPASSAEWIEEAPSVGGQQSDLANYGYTIISNETVNGQTPKLTPQEAGVMVQNNTLTSVPSFQSQSHGDGFALAYVGNGSSSSSESESGSNGWAMMDGFAMMD